MIDTSKLSDIQVVACTLYGEARSEPTDGILAVACVIRNRVKDSFNRWPKSYRDVCLQPKQFSVWNEDSGGNHDRLAQLVATIAGGGSPDDRFKECAWIATGIVNDWCRDTTGGADHYHVATMKDKPTWAQGMVPLSQTRPPVKLAHVFYKLAPLVKKSA